MPSKFLCKIVFINKHIIDGMNSTLNTQSNTHECYCDEKKKYRLIFDGGDSGNYIVEYCQKCYDSDDKQFMISVEELL